MNRLLETVFGRIVFDRGSDSRESCVLRALLERCKLNAFEYIPMHIFKAIETDCGVGHNNNIVEYLVERLKLFDLHFRLYLDGDEHVDLDYERLQLALKEEFFDWGGVKYDRKYIGSHVFVFLSPRNRFRRLLKEFSV